MRGMAQVEALFRSKKSESSLIVKLLSKKVLRHSQFWTNRKFYFDQIFDLVAKKCQNIG